MGPEVYIYTQNHEFTRIDIPMDQQGWSDEKPVVIEDDVWIGSRVTILGGVTIGRGSIIGASSVVTKSCPPYSIVAGNPAQVVKKRTAVYLEN
jgi:galactoside O-acetyltransferase